ncbi:hypothetical protein [Cupriavidus basilensis]|uniref:TRAFAC clade GTPase domain-containing protein n=1 Tax=Cupriavidus basilensis TaxID=68895 RepID=UPI0020A64F24|nr:hypothetical protein [Cupriavidus basilensis]MCP3024546.1 hypothetical protein [Cupriavidus basilensis]
MTSLLVVGMPNSGKSTFIAALRHLLVADEVAIDLCSIELSESEGHLNRLENRWLDCEEMERTKPATEGWVELKVQDKRTYAHLTLRIPDLRGEAFEQPACIGQCDADLFDALADADGILLFTNADREDDALLIDDLLDLLGPDILDANEPESPPEEDSETINTLSNGSEVAPAGEDAENAFKPEEMPEEVKLVEFLQVANRRPLSSRRRKIAIIISAWDVVGTNVKGDGITAELWFATRRPMLSQFIEANSDLWDTRVYGVSAQGGRLPEDKSALEKVRVPSKRIRIVGHGAAEHDLSAPLRWMLPLAD